MKFHEETKPLYVDTDVFGIGLGSTLLQTRKGATYPRDIAPDSTILRPITFASKSLTSTEQRYSNIKRGIVYIAWAWKFCHYCFAREVSKITVHKPLVAILKKMLQHCHKEYNVFSSGYTNSEPGNYTSLDQIFSLQTGCPDKNIKRTKTQKYQVWI